MPDILPFEGSRARDSLEFATTLNNEYSTI